MHAVTPRQVRSPLLIAVSTLLSAMVLGSCASSDGLGPTNQLPVITVPRTVTAGTIVTLQIANLSATAWEYGGCPATIDRRVAGRWVQQWVPCGPDGSTRSIEAGEELLFGLWIQEVEGTYRARFSFRTAPGSLLEEAWAVSNSFQAKAALPD